MEKGPHIWVLSPCPYLERVSSNLWITRAKLWISRLNWGKLLDSFSPRPANQPPYMGGTFATPPYVQNS